MCHGAMRRRPAAAGGGPAAPAPAGQPPRQPRPARRRELTLACPVPAAPLLLFRSCWACCLAKELYDELPRLPAQYGAGLFNFKYLVLDVATPSLPALHAIFGLLFVALGYLVLAPWLEPRRLPMCVSRAACLLVLLGYGFVFLLEAQRYNNHYYLSVLLAAWLALTPISRSLTVPAWGLAAVRWQIAAVYAFGGLAKLSDDWLSGATWLSLRSSVQHGASADLIATTAGALEAIGAPPEWRGERAAGQLLSWGGAAFDLGVGPLLLARWRPAVWLGVASASAFHLSNLFSFTIGVFPVTMLATGPLFLGYPATAATLRMSPPEPRTRGAKPGGKPGGKGATGGWGWAARLGVALAASQLLLPLRSYGYGPPAQTLWSTDGSHFSWRMMTHSIQFLQCTFTLAPPAGSAGANVTL